MSRPPSKGVWTDRYGPRVNPITHAEETHHGLDINAAAGTTLVAPESGVLASWGPLSGWSVQGNVAVINGDDGWVHWLAHTDRPLARVGERVDEGQSVAVMGMSGQTTGLHVHWETRFHGARLNPENWLAQTTTTPEDEMNPTQEATLNNLASIASEIRNMLTDPSTGVWKATAPAARDNAAAAKASADNAANIASDIRNLIVDPKIGVLAAIGRMSSGNIDVAALAAQLRETLGGAVADELARRLTS